MSTIEIIYICCGIASFIILFVVYIIVKPSFRRKSKNTVRKNIKLYVDKIEKSYRGKITTLEKNGKMPPVKIPLSDINDFKNLNDLYNGAENLLSKKEGNSIYELIALFEKGKYNDTTSPSGEAITGDVIYKIADLAKKLQDLIKKKVN